MTGFDELVGATPTGAERERLRDVHELLVNAGPPPELTPEVAVGHTFSMTRSRGRRSSRRRRPVVLAAAAALVMVVIGLGLSIHGQGTRYPQLLLRGTSLAPTARGHLDILRTNGPRPRLRLEVKNLPALKEHYVVYLVRDGHPIAPCGTFRVTNADRETTKSLVSPYRLERSDSWIVTLPSRSGATPGRTVMEPVT